MARITLKARKTLTLSADVPQALSIYTVYKTGQLKIFKFI